MKTMRAGAQGVKIRVKGRLGGSEMARVEWNREGRGPAAHPQGRHRLRPDGGQDHLRRIGVGLGSHRKLPDRRRPTRVAGRRRGTGRRRRAGGRQPAADPAPAVDTGRSRGDRGRSAPAKCGARGHSDRRRHCGGAGRRKPPRASKAATAAQRRPPTRRAAARRSARPGPRPNPRRPRAS